MLFKVWTVFNASTTQPLQIIGNGSTCQSIVRCFSPFSFDVERWVRSCVYVNDGLQTVIFVLFLLHSCHWTTMDLLSQLSSHGIFYSGKCQFSASSLDRNFMIRIFFFFKICFSMSITVSFDSLEYRMIILVLYLINYNILLQFYKRKIRQRKIRMIIKR